MGLMLDSSVLIAAERERLTVSLTLRRLSERWPGTDVAVSVITAGELLHGVWRAKSAERRARREQFVESVLSEVPVVSVTVPIIRVFAELDAYAAEKGNQIGVQDLLIASSALYRGDDVVTGNAKHFRRIPGLAVHEFM